MFFGTVFAVITIKGANCPTTGRRTRPLSRGKCGRPLLGEVIGNGPAFILAGQSPAYRGLSTWRQRDNDAAHLPQ